MRCLVLKEKHGNAGWKTFIALELATELSSEVLNSRLREPSSYRLGFVLRSKRIPRRARAGPMVRRLRCGDQDGPDHSSARLPPPVCVSRERKRVFSKWRDVRTRDGARRRDCDRSCGGARSFTCALVVLPVEETLQAKFLARMGLHRWAVCDIKRHL